MIEFKNVTKRYPNGVEAVKDMSLKIEQGEFVYVIGPSGSGKTTFMKLMYAAERPTKGRVRVNDYSIESINTKEIPYLRREVGVVFQDFKLLPKLTVYENVAYAMEVTGKSKKEIKQRVDEVLELVRLKHKFQQYPDELSGGEQQRVAIARAIANRPRILVTDEPTGNLDPENAISVLRILEAINRNGTTVLMGTHNDALVNENPHRVIRIERGRLISDEKEGSYSEVF